MRSNCVGVQGRAPSRAHAVDRLQAHVRAPRPRRLPQARRHAALRVVQAPRDRIHVPEGHRGGRQRAGVVVGRQRGISNRLRGPTAARAHDRRGPGDDPGVHPRAPQVPGRASHRARLAVERGARARRRPQRRRRRQTRTSLRRRRHVDRTRDGRSRDQKRFSRDGRVHTARGDRHVRRGRRAARGHPPGPRRGGMGRDMPGGRRGNYWSRLPRHIRGRG